MPLGLFEKVIGGLVGRLPLRFETESTEMGTGVWQVCRVKREGELVNLVVPLYM